LQPSSRPFVMLMILPQERHEDVHIKKPNHWESPSISLTREDVMTPPGVRMTGSPSGSVVTEKDAGTSTPNFSTRWRNKVSCCGRGNVSTAASISASVLMQQRCLNPRKAATVESSTSRQSPPFNCGRQDSGPTTAAIGGSDAKILESKSPQVFEDSSLGRLGTALRPGY
jgi:hypothetical protein